MAVFRWMIDGYLNEVGLPLGDCESVKMRLDACFGLMVSFTIMTERH